MGSNKITDQNRLSINRPDLSAEWNYSKNDVNPNEVACNSTKLVWWKCSKCGFEWQCKIVYRNRYSHQGLNDRTRTVKTPAFCPCCQSNIILIKN